MPRIRNRQSWVEKLAHGDLSDMPDIGMINSDHDARYDARYDIRYLRLDGSNIPTANYTGWTTDLGTSGKIGAGNDSPAYPLDILLSASDNLGIHLDGYTNDYTTNASGNCISSQRDLDLTSLGDHFNNLHLRTYLVHTAADMTGDHSVRGIDTSLELDVGGTITLPIVSNQTFYLNNIETWINDNITYDTTSTGELTVVERGAYLYTHATPTFDDTGGFTPDRLLQVFGADIRVEGWPTLTAGPLDVETYGARIFVRGSNIGDSVTYGIYIDTVSEADANYAIYDTSRANWVLASDNQKIRLGATQGDFDLYSDGTDGQLDATADIDIHPTTKTTIGDGGTTNYSKFESDGTLEFNGAATVWRDMQFEISNAKVPAANFPTWEIFTTNTKEYSFAVNDYIDMKASELPHWWKQGTAGHVHLHVTTKAGNATGFNRFAKFRIWISYCDTGETWQETDFTAELTIPHLTLALQLFYLDVGDLVLTTYLIGGETKLRVKRIAATGGTEYAGNIFLTQAGIHLECDTVGSRGEITK